MPLITWNLLEVGITHIVADDIKSAKALESEGTCVVFRVNLTTVQS
ncbi:MAG: hypothetical protein IPO86_02190 [Saprospiraceae bacterium]|nr:hypothetical protein [Saprospiraceae bacterium]MBK9726906.1 hypothetical protein [Saprospiraceae bacterium]